ncbi:TetR/AcrR family transcriptional regulator [Actinocatenispora thailandica]|uniref:TetR/AcrR family transcriptional regulator n=1 Tax=Actinocatenispora thailandica TaxID=227318 RepID=UPI0019521E40|nr:TetR/AcrR family transcriptional regulator [Actinocatenispora thailandica]
MATVKPRQRRTPRPEVRSRVLLAAARVFADRGFAAASIDEVAAGAGFTKGAVYSNFGSKDELFFALLDEQIASRTALVTELSTDPTIDPGDLVRTAGDRLTAAMAGNRDWQLLFLEYWLRAMRDEATRRRFVAYRRDLLDSLTTAVAELLGAAGITDAAVARELVLLAVGLSNGLALEELPAPGTVPAGLLGDALAAHLRRPRAGGDGPISSGRGGIRVVGGGQVAEPPDR